MLPRTPAVDRVLKGFSDGSPLLSAMPLGHCPGVHVFAIHRVG